MARQMKDSGVEWIGEIPEAWTCSRVGLHYNIILGKMLCSSPQGEDYTLEPYLCAADVHFEGITPVAKKCMWFSDEEKRNLLVKKGDLLVTEGGAGGCAIVPERETPTYIQNSLMIVRGLYGASVGYLRYWLENLIKSSYLDYLCNKVTIIHFTKEKLSRVPMPMPSYAEQENIFVHLDTRCAEIDKVVEQTRATIEEYKKLKQAIITEAVTKGVRGSRPMKPSGVEWIGDIPEGWLSHKLKYVSSIKSGDYVDAQELSSDGMYPVYGGGEQISSYHSYNVNEETIIIGRVGARCGCVTLTKQKCWATDNALILSTNMYTRFAYYLLTGANLNTLNTSNAQPLITGTKIMNLVISNPCKDEQQEIATYLDTKCAEIDRIIEKKEQLIEELGSYKKSLIYEYVTGKREIKIHNYSESAIC